MRKKAGNDLSDMYSGDERKRTSDEVSKDKYDVVKTKLLGLAWDEL
jgi:hypothetical protein